MAEKRKKTLAFAVRTAAALFMAAAAVIVSIHFIPLYTAAGNARREKEMRADVAAHAEKAGNGTVLDMSGSIGGGFTVHMSDGGEYVVFVTDIPSRRDGVFCACMCDTQTGKPAEAWIFPEAYSGMYGACTVTRGNGGNALIVTNTATGGVVCERAIPDI